MRYINKEYGFAFRPPFHNKFYEERKEGPPLSPENFPHKVYLGAGYDYTSINGAILVGKNGTPWGIKVSCLVGGKWFDNDDFIHRLSAASANTKDGSFAHFASGPFSAKWVKASENGMYLQLSARKKMRVRVIFYPCFGFAGELSIENTVVKGRSPYLGIFSGSVNLSETGSIYRDRKLVVCDNTNKQEYFFAQSYQKPSDTANGAFNEAIMEFVIHPNQPSVYVYATVGDEEIFNTGLPEEEKIVQQIKIAELLYGVNKTMGTGTLGAPVERMLNSILWSRMYYPYFLTEIFSPTRTLLNKHFEIQGIEENCSAILGALVDAEKAMQQMKYTLEDPVLALFAVWNLYAHHQDKSDLLKIHKSLLALYPPTAELVVSNDKERKSVAFKWHDSPLKEQGNGGLFSLDLSCFRLLAFDLLERICALLDLPIKSEYKAAKEEMITLINDTLWNETLGIYQNRFTTGDWSENIGATSFYPLVAGAVNCPKKLASIVNFLTDPKQFWTEYLVPTLPVSNFEFGKKGKPNNNGQRAAAFLEYRGSIIPYVNYLIYQGLVRYGLDELAGELALRSAKLWSLNESDNVENYSVYSPKGKRYKSKNYLSSNGNMLACMGVNELIDIEYFRPDLRTDAIRFGTFTQGNHSLTNLKLFGKSYSIEVRDDATVLLIDNYPVFRGDGGRFVVRNFLQLKTGFEFMIDTKAEIVLSLVTQLDTKNFPYSFVLHKGKHKVSAENGEVKIGRI